MNRPISAILAGALLSPTLGWAACEFNSGPKTTALVELYTSEGCSSCPPADRVLEQVPIAGIRSGAGRSDLASRGLLGLHRLEGAICPAPVLGRQSWLVHANGHTTVFTPHFFVSGTEVRDWHGDLDDQLKRIVGRPARAVIRIHAESTGPETLAVAASAAAPLPAGQLGLFVALTEDKLTSQVSTGENRGVTLSHDHVVREWIGPIALNAGHADIRQAVSTRSNWNRAQLGIIAFVQDLRTGEVLQAAGASQCLRS